MAPRGSTHSFLPRLLFFLRCLLFQVMKTERLTEMFHVVFVTRTTCQSLLQRLFEPEVKFDNTPPIFSLAPLKI